MTMADIGSLAVTDRRIDGPHGQLHVRTYEQTGNPPLAGFVWVHGGAFAFGDLDMPEADWVARQIAASGIPVVSVAYQLAGTAGFAGALEGVEQRDGVLFPVASEEVSAAFEWAATSGEFGVPEGHWSLGGASAGANLSAGAALRLRDEGRAQPRSIVLAYPLVHAELPPHRPELARKIDALPPDARFEPEAVLAININYVGDPAVLASPYAFPGTQDLHGLPPVFILNSDADSLRSSGELFASELAAAGVDLLLIREDGTWHGHLNEPGSPGATRSIERLVAWLIPNPLVGTAHETSQHPGAASS